MTLILSSPMAQYNRNDESQTRSAIESEDKKNLKRGMPEDIYLNSYTVAGAPNPSPPGKLAYISNETGGAVIAFSDGTNWRRVTDRAVIA